jgi:hypothetical protein
MVVELFKKRGFTESLLLLASFEGGEAPQNEYFKKFETNQSYYNAFLRVKGMLIKYSLIDFKCTQDGTKIIFLTDKGRSMVRLLKEIETLLESPKRVLKL